MKKTIFKTGLALMGSLTLGTALLPVTTVLADEDTKKQTETNQLISNFSQNSSEEDIIDFSSLSTEEADYFTSKGFDESDEYFTVTTMQEPPNSLSLGRNARAVNVVTLTGSTKKISNTQSRTEYIISSTQAPFIRFNASLDMGGKKTVNSAITTMKGAYVYKGGIYGTYTGKRQYLGYTLRVQYTTTWGSATVSKKVGGMTIGR